MENEFANGYIVGQDSRNNGNGGFWGDGLWAIIILAMLGFGGGWGGMGFGGMGGMGGMWLNGMATRADINEGFALNNITGGITAIQQGICDSTYSLNSTLMGGFHGVDSAICNLGYQTQQGFNTLGFAMKDCCCETQRLIERGFCDTAGAIAGSTRDILENNNANTRAILDFLTQDKIASLTAENQALRFSASQDRQNAYLTTAMTAQTNALIERIAPYPVPSYAVPAPYPYCGNAGYGYGNSGCGCGC